MKTVIVGGVAGGMSAATRLRRLDANADIVVFERGEHVSYANCGLPYHLGGVISDRKDLLLQTPEGLGGRFGLDVRIRTEVLSIDRERRTVRVRDLDRATEYDESWDVLVLSPGAAPIVPDLPGIEGALPLRTVTDADRVVTAMRGQRPRTAAVIGGGFIGLEVAENLTRRGLAVSVVELDRQVLAPLDPEMAAGVHAQLRAHGVTLCLGTGPAKVLADAVELTDGRLIDAELVLLAIGVRPEVGLARTAGLAVGSRGGIVVDASMRTRGERSVQWHQLDNLLHAGTTLIDVRTPAEHHAGHIPGSINIPLDELRGRLDELPAGDLVVYCQVGQRAHTAAALVGDPVRVANLDGGYLTWLAGSASRTDTPSSAARPTRSRQGNASTG
ncbi:FAD-dependent oxidoreductase [Plantactinospora sp. B6F1]|uniref:FAD-dependent oxidoreductase n=1 Tax=Plantactinospora sp. B6F1 TaxID=3158971 RepID=UPI0032D95E0C